VLVRRFLYLTLRESRLDRLDHAAESVDLVKVIKAAIDHLLGERLKIPAATERVDSINNTGLLRDDLLGPQGDQSGLVGGQSQGLVIRICVQGLRTAEYAGQSLDRNPSDVVERLLDGQ